MTLTTSVKTDPEALTMTVSVELEVPTERVWQLWADPRQLERWWGPPEYPATVVGHDLVPGGRVTLFMTGPEGDKTDMFWDVLAADPPKRLEVRDGDVDESGRPNDGNGITTMVVTLSERTGGGTLMATEIHFYSLEGLEQSTAMGMEEGFAITMGQMEGVLADD